MVQGVRCQVSGLQYFFGNEQRVSLQQNAMKRNAKLNAVAIRTFVREFVNQPNPGFTHSHVTTEVESRDPK